MRSAQQIPSSSLVVQEAEICSGKFEDSLFSLRQILREKRFSLRQFLKLPLLLCTLSNV
ncbi:hypothetical protein NC653_025344 [Populus alba x Populus x berolinensis]|uniref:Uncharacterized protein n=1 Tax=Populus alba x Populus x berolinensis TaxID=444605 RepID=A0AAD6MDE4_9ROSI|nr:hypothetical protein NC653_025344 [Populus alba x Populus x berolinensis]